MTGIIKFRFFFFFLPGGKLEMEIVWIWLTQRMLNICVKGNTLIDPVGDAIDYFELHRIDLDDAFHMQRIELFDSTHVKFDV